uniref:C2H2-type domain-containing protein n=1 Tax=Graphocephala atropunctata TaxID=36148 RepID=A0A1B6MMQ7_9HEMI
MTILSSVTVLHCYEYIVFNMQESKATKEDTVFDLTEDSDEDCQFIKLEPKDPGPVFDLTADEDEEESDDQQTLKKPEEESKSQQELSPKEKPNDNVKQKYSSMSPEKGESSGTLPTRSFRNFDKSLEKAVNEIRTGGSLVAVAAHYGIPQDVVYKQLVSSGLHRKMDILTKFEENNLVKWILKSNEKNSLIFKHHLLNKVGKLKKVSKITPIFSKSKYGKMWYEYFLKSHPEIYENDGLLMPSGFSEVDNISPRKPSVDKCDAQQNAKRGTIDIIKDVAELRLSFGIKEVKVVLYDYRKLKTTPFDPNEKENMPLQSRNDSVSDSELEKCIVKKEPQRTTDIQNVTSSDFGKDVSSVLYVKIKKEKRERKFSGLRFQCEKCQKTFSKKPKLLQHLALHTPKELYTITCYKCDKKFPSNYHFKLHIKLVHSKLYYGCDFCGNVFKHRTSLRNHQRKIHSNPTEIVSNFTCDMCGKSFKYKNSLEDHIIYGHMKEKKKYTCDICKRNFIKHSAMLRHKLKHSKIKPFSCLECQKTFSRKYLLREHTNVCNKNEKTSVNIDCLEISKQYLEGISLD